MQRVACERCGNEIYRADAISTRENGRTVYRCTVTCKRRPPYCVRVTFVLIERADNGDLYETSSRTYTDHEAVVWRGDALETALDVRRRFSVLPEVETAEVLGWRDGEWHGTTTPKDQDR